MTKRNHGTDECQEYSDRGLLSGPMGSAADQPYHYHVMGATMMPKKASAFLLVVLALLGQFDDVLLASASFAQSVPPASEDEYLPTPQRSEQNDFPKANAAGCQPSWAKPALLHSGLPCAYKLYSPWVACPFYLLLSLQI